MRNMSQGAAADAANPVDTDFDGPMGTSFGKDLELSGSIFCGREGGEGPKPL